MKLKVITNEDGTYSLYNQTEKRFIVENGSKEDVYSVKKQVDLHRRNKNKIRRGVR